MLLPPSRFRLVTAVVAIALAAVLGSCAGDAPQVPVGPDGEVDEALDLGRDVFVARCASCHGMDGGGARGPKLSDGEVLAAYPDADDQRRVVAEGEGAMPSFEASLSADEIDAVVRYTREVLAE